MNPRATPPAAERILLIRLGAVGDVVRTLPAASVLRGAYPDATLAWLVERASASVLEEQPWIDEVIVFPREELREALRAGRMLRLARRAERFRRELRARHFDLVADFHGILKSGVLARLSGAPCRVGYARPFAREGAALFASERARLAPRRQSRFRRNEALARYLGLDGDPLPRPLQVSEERRRRMAVALAGGPAPVAIHPGTSPATLYKRWTAHGYGAVARTLAETTGVPSIVTCGPAEEEQTFADAVVAASGGAARRAPTTPSLADLAALFACSRLYLGSDTGPMHVASLVGTPVVQLLGPTDPIENAPYAETPSRSVRVGVACSPCRRGCAAATCMRAISVDAVVTAAKELLAVPSPGC